MESCAPANQFFRYYLLRGAIGSKKSWASTGRALYDYFSFLQAHELSWDDVDRGEEKTLLAAYRDYSFEVAKLARSTVRNRLLYVCEFYSFAQRQQWIETLPFGYETRRVIKNAGLLAHLDASGARASVRDVMPRAHKDWPRFLSGEQIRALLAAATNPHHRMIIRLSLGSGLRRTASSTRPLMRRKPNCSASPSLSSGRRRASMTRRSACVKVRNASISKALRLPWQLLQTQKRGLPFIHRSPRAARDSFPHITNSK